MTDWVVRPFRPGDEPRIIRLYEAVHGRAPGEVHFRWKLLDSPVPLAAPTVWLAEAGDRLIGQYAGTPLRFKLDGEERIVVHVSDVMTDPRHRRRGVLGTMGRTAHEAWRAAGVSFLVGLPNDQWGSRRRYLDFRPQFPLRWYRRPLHADRALTRRLGPLAPLARATAPLWAVYRRIAALPLRRSARHVTVSDAAGTEPVFDRIWDDLGPQYPALVVRDRSRIAYRFAAPDQAHRILVARRRERPLGYLAYRLTGDERAPTGWIVDCFTAPDDEAARSALALEALEQMAAVGAGSVRGLAPGSTALARSLRRAGFSPAAGRFDVCVVPLLHPTPPRILGDPAGWFTTAADYDVA